MSFVVQILPRARERLVLLEESQPLVAAARMLATPDCDMIVVTGQDGRMTGIVTKTDLVARFGQCEGESCTAPVSEAMGREVVSSRGTDELHEVWAQMKTRGLKNLPLLDEEDRPVGVVNARDVLGALLSSSENEGALLRDYVMSVSYR